MGMVSSFTQTQFRCIRCGATFWQTVTEHSATRRCRRCRSVKENKEIDAIVKRKLEKQK